MRFDTVASVVVSFSVLGAPILSFLWLVRNRLFLNHKRTFSLLLSVLSFCAISLLLLAYSDDFDPVWVMPPYIGVLVGANVWVWQWHKRLGYNRLSTLLVVLSTGALWAVVNNSETTQRTALLACITVIYVHALFYELWVQDTIRQYYEPAK